METMIRQCSSAWKMDLQDVTKLVSTRTPSGWDIMKANYGKDLSDPEQIYMIVLNPHHVELHRGNELLTSMLVDLRLFSKDGCGPFVDAAVMQAAFSVNRLAADVIMHAYVSYSVWGKIYSEQSAALRFKQAQTLQGELKTPTQKALAAKMAPHLSEALKNVLTSPETGRTALDFETERKRRAEQ
jgi:phage baseplate assembly protein W